MSDTLDELPAQLKAVEVPGKPFYVQNQKLLLTYVNHLNKNAYCSWLTSKTKQKPRFLRLAHETGGTDYQHTHVLVDFGYKFQTKNSRLFDFNGVHPNIRVVNSLTHWRNCLRYLAKEDLDNEDLLEIETPKFDVCRVWEAGTLQEAMEENVKSASDVMACKIAFECRPRGRLRKSFNEFEPRPWQQHVMDLLDTEPDDRSIHWYHDPVGNSGKSLLSKYLMTTDPGSYYVVNFGGNMRDFGSIMKSALDAGWTGHAVIFDLPRQAQTKSLWEPLEAVKNGLITTVKYQGHTLTFDSPHVLVFANFLPDVTRMSLDRWRVHRILRDMTLQDLTVEQLMEEELAELTN